MKHTQTLNLLALSFAIASSLVSAESKNLNGIEVLTTTASRTSVALSASLASQIVITQDDIKALQPNSIMDLLNAYASIDVSSTGGRGQNSTVFFRGANAGHTLVMINGIRLSSSTLGLTDITKLSVNNIERIEIIKGPRASLWGSDAIGGVIQIFTKSAGHPSVELKAGTNNFKSFLFESALEHGDGQTSFLFDHQKSNGFDVLEGGDPDDDGYAYQSLTVNGYQKVDDRLVLNWLVNVDRGDNQYDSLFGGDNASRHSNKQIQFGGSYAWDDNSSHFSFSNQVDDTNTYEDGAPFLNGTSIKSSRLQLTASNTTEINGNSSFTIGTDLLTETVDGTQEYGIDERDLSAIFAQYMNQGKEWSFEGSLRHDVVQMIDSETTHNIALGYKVNNDIKVSVMQGRGFKVPTFNDLYWPLDAYSKGNSELKSERSNNVELKLAHSLRDVDYSISVYHNKIDQLIQWQPDQNFVYQPQNIAAADIKGAELSVSAEFNDIAHQFTASWLKPIDESTGDTLTLRAKKQFTYRVSLLNDGTFKPSIDIRYVGERSQMSWDGSATKLVGHTVMNANIQYRLNKKVEFALSVKDVFEQAEPTAVGYNVEGRQIFLSTSLTF